MTITGINLENLQGRFREFIQLYRFDFLNNNEESNFVNFQKFILNYQRHSKNQVEFIKKEKSWYLLFIPMP